MTRLAKICTEKTAVIPSYVLLDFRGGKKNNLPRYIPQNYHNCVITASVSPVIWKQKPTTKMPEFFTQKAESCDNQYRHLVKTHINER